MEIYLVQIWSYLNLPEGYTQSIEINSPYEAVIDIT